MPRRRNVIAVGDAALQGEEELLAHHGVVERAEMVLDVAQGLDELCRRLLCIQAAEELGGVAQLLAGDAKTMEILLRQIGALATDRAQLLVALAQHARCEL